MCLTALRATALENELSIWSVSDEGGQAFEAGRLPALIAEKGVAPLAPGEAGSLWRAERSLELARKAQLLQDAWTPWFEGLAIFAEVASDPALDPVGINPVAEALRYLVDFHPTPGSDGVFDDREKIVKEFDAFAEEFERACSEAMNKAGPDRLYAYLKNPQVPYFAGYLAVRGVVAAWRRTTGRALTATECLLLLLHATRFGSDDFIPDLSLHSEEFGAHAVAGMVRWAAQLALLPRDVIEDFLTPPEKTAPGRSFIWSSGHPVPVEMNAEIGQIQSRHLRERVAQAFASLTHPEDSKRLEGVDPFCAKLVAHCDSILRSEKREKAWQRTLDRYSDIAERFITIGSLFPLGTAQSKFFLNRDELSGRALLMTLLRTTEKHVDTGEVSVNGFGFPIDVAESESIAARYRLRGEPRVTATRLIDLGGVASSERPLPGLHFLVFTYGDWMHLQGPNQATDKLIRSDPERFAALAELAKARVMPNPELSAELRFIAAGEAGAQRTRD